jgi:hypothetical protein
LPAPDLALVCKKEETSQGMQSFALVDLRSNAPPDLLGEQIAEDEDRFGGSGANFKKGRRADPGALGERESLACQIGPKFKLCTRSCYNSTPRAEIKHKRLPLENR